MPQRTTYSVDLTSFRHRDPNKATFTAGRIQTCYRRGPPQALPEGRRRQGGGAGGALPPAVENDIRDEYSSSFSQVSECTSNLTSDALPMTLEGGDVEIGSRFTQSGHAVPISAVCLHVQPVGHIRQPHGPQKDTSIYRIRTRRILACTLPNWALRTQVWVCCQTHPTVCSNPQMYMVGRACSYSGYCSLVESAAPVSHHSASIVRRVTHRRVDASLTIYSPYATE